MDINTALERLSGYIDFLYEELPEEDRELINEVENTIYKYVKEKEN